MLRDATGDTIARVSSRGQLVIPARLRKRYGIREGTQVNVIDRGGEIILQPITREYLRSLRGMIRSDTSVVEEIAREHAREREESRGGSAAGHARARPG